MPVVNVPGFWNKLKNKFNFTEGQQKVDALPYMFLVSSVDDLLKTPDIKTSGNVSIPSTATYTFYTVPKGKRWYLHWANVYLVTGTYTFDAISLYDGSERATFPITSSANINKEWTEKKILDEDWLIQARCDTWGVIGNAVMLIYVEEEDAFE